MPEQKKIKTWYPFGSPEWWKGFGQREARGWQQTGRRLGEVVDIFNPLTPLPPFWEETKYAPPRYPMPTMELQKPGGVPLRGYEKGRIPQPVWWEVELGAQPATVGMADEFTRKAELYGQIIDVAGLLRKSPEEVEADLRGQLLENAVITDENASLEDILNILPYSGLAAIYASLRTQANRLPTTDRAFGRKASLGEDVDVLDAMARRQTQDSAFINEFLPQFESAIQGAQTKEEVDKIQWRAQQLLEQNLQERMYEYGTYQSVQFLGDTKRNEIMTQEGTLLKAEYPKWWEQYVRQTPAGEVTARQGFEIGFPTWAQKQEEFGQARLEKETDLYTRFPELYSRYKQAPVSQRAEAGGFMPWTLGSPETRAFYFKQREFEERPKARRTPQWAI